jgi:hypothetical protein
VPAPLLSAIELPPALLPVTLSLPLVTRHRRPGHVTVTRSGRGPARTLGLELMGHAPAVAFAAVELRLLQDEGAQRRGPQLRLLPKVRTSSRASPRGPHVIRLEGGQGEG